jgi:hypothetical protein
VTFWKRQDELEARLKASRPEAPPELVDNLVARIEGDVAHRQRGLRIGVAVAITAAALGVFGAFGGLSYAAKAVSKATGIPIVKASKGGRPAPPARGANPSPSPSPSSSPAEDQYPHQLKVTICHHTNGPSEWVVITVSIKSLKAHKAHGDTLVNPTPPPLCPGPPIPDFPPPFQP